MEDGNDAPRVALVTGGSRGIGAATVERLARDGWTVAFSYANRADAAEALVSRVRAAGGHALAVRADVAEEADVMALFRAVDEAFGRLDALVNNAGIVAPPVRVEELDAARLARMMAVNVTGAFLCAREAVRRMAPRHGGRGGSIVNVSSVAARLGSPGEYVDYAASKAAVDTMTLGLAKEVAADGIRVNAVRPGIIDTEIHASGGQPDRVARVVGTGAIPLGRAGTAEEIADAICWLLSGATYCTGTLLDVTGGR